MLSDFNLKENKIMWYTGGFQPIRELALVFMYQDTNVHNRCAPEWTFFVHKFSYLKKSYTLSCEEIIKSVT